MLPQNRQAAFYRQRRMADHSAKSARSSFDLPAEVLGTVFRAVSVLGKIHCEQVCKRWRHLLSLSTSHDGDRAVLPLDIWAAKLTVVVQQRTTQQLIYKQDDNSSDATIHLITASNELSARHTSFAKWLGQRAGGMRKLRIMRVHTIRQGPLPEDGWVLLFPQLLLSLTRGCQRGFDGPFLSMSTELNSFLQSVQCCRLLGRMLTSWEAFSKYQSETENLFRLSMLTSLTTLVISDDSNKLRDHDLAGLTKLHRLHTLVLPRFSGLYNKVDSFSGLQCLQLGYNRESGCDLSICMQLTYLKLYHLSDQTDNIRLPYGDSVALQVLELTKSAVRNCTGLAIQYLDKALQLSRLHFNIPYPDNYFEGGWPDLLPRLQILTLLAPSDIPVQLLKYTSLQNLDLSGISEHLPFWFSGMTQLKNLNLEGAKCGFQECVLDLAQLERLNLMNAEPPLQLSDSLLRLSDWQHLCSLKMSFAAHGYQPGIMETIMNLMLLQEAFEARSTVSPLTVNGERGVACLCNSI